MPGNMIAEYLVGLGFEIDAGGAQEAEKLLQSISNAAQTLDKSLQAAAASIQKSFKGLKANGFATLIHDAQEYDGRLAADAARFEEAAGAADAYAGAVRRISEASNAGWGGRAISDFTAALDALAPSLDSTLTGIQRGGRLGAEALIALRDSAKQLSEGLPALFEGVGTASAAASDATALKGDIKAIFDGLERGAAAAMGPADAVMHAFSGIGGRVTAAAKTAISALSGISKAVRSAAGSIKSEFGAAASAVVSHVGRIKASINSIPRSITVSVTTKGAFSEGGVVDHETQATIGEGGRREYVIPVTKPARAVPLLKAAMKDMGMTLENAQGAIGQLGGNATANTPPGYSHAQTFHNTSVSNNTVSAPATINVYGSEAKSIAKSVQHSHEMLVIRSLKGVLA